jgi:hypothetical protein
VGPKVNVDLAGDETSHHLNSLAPALVYECDECDAGFGS